MFIRRLALATGVAVAVAVAGAATVIPTAVRAQHAGGAPPTSTRAPKEAAQYDFMIGQWDLVVKPTVSSLAARLHGAPKMAGSWKSWRAMEGWGVEDEMRIVDESGNPRSLAKFVRVYDAAAKLWRIAAVDAYRGTVSQSTATWNGTAFETSGTAATDGDDKAYTGRSRFTDITPTSFVYMQERTYDNGKKWDVTLRIEAKRVSATAPR